MTRLAARYLAGPCLVSEPRAALCPLAGTRPSLLRQVGARWRASGHARTQVPVAGRVSCCLTRTGITERGHPREALEFAHACPPHVRVLRLAERRLAGHTSTTLPSAIAGPAMQAKLSLTTGARGSHELTV